MRWLVVLALLAGCDRWETSVPAWSIALESPEIAVGPDHAGDRASTDDTLVVLDSIRIADRTLVGVNAVRLDRNGAIKDIVPIPDIRGAPRRMLVDERGRPVIAWYGLLVALDEQLAVRWTSPSNVYSAYAVAPNGDVVFAVGNTELLLVYKNADGTDRWRVPLSVTDGASPSIVGDEVIVRTDDVFTRVRATDGEILGTFTGPDVHMILRDGARVTAHPLAIYEPSGALRWKRDIDYVGIVMTTEGELVVQHDGTVDIHLDPATGETLVDETQCNRHHIYGGTGGYYTVGPDCNGDPELGFYPSY